HNHHDAYGGLPEAIHRSQGNLANGTNYDLTGRENPIRRFNWTIAVQPFIEQDNLYKIWNFTNFNANRGVVGDPLTCTWRTVATFVCPSDDLPDPAIDFSEHANSPPRDWGLTSYGANAGRRSYRRADQTNDGPFIHNVSRKMADIADGTSNTIFVG